MVHVFFYLSLESSHQGFLASHLLLDDSDVIGHLKVEPLQVLREVNFELLRVLSRLTSQPDGLCIVLAQRIKEAIDLLLLLLIILVQSF